MGLNSFQWKDNESWRNIDRYSDLARESYLNGEHVIDAIIEGLEIYSKDEKSVCFLGPEDKFENLKELMKDCHGIRIYKDEDNEVYSQTEIIEKEREIINFLNQQKNGDLHL